MELKHESNRWEIQFVLSRKCIDKAISNGNNDNNFSVEFAYVVRDIERWKEENGIRENFVVDRMNR